MGGRKGGRKPIPSCIHILQGGRSKTHRPLPENEPHPPAIIPKCPRHLDQEARKEWRRSTKELEPLGMLTKLDMAVLASYCQSFSTWAKATEQIHKTGMLIKASTGTPMINPLFPIANKAEEKMLKALVEIGMSPSSRSRVKVTPPPKKDEAEDFLKEGRGGK